MEMETSESWIHVTNQLCDPGQVVLSLTLGVHSLLIHWDQAYMSPPWIGLLESSYLHREGHPTSFSLLNHSL